MNESETVKFCVVVPGFQEERHIGEVVTGIREYCPTVIVVDDGSTDRTADVAEAAGAVILKHEVNKGKGAALETGYEYALESGFEVVIAMDADGQHDPADLPGFLEVYRKTGAPVVLGNRMHDPQAMPFVRRMTNRFMSWLLSREMGVRVPDTQNGFRLFHRDVIPYLVTESERFAADSEVLLNLAKHGVRIESAPIKVIYRDEKSKIRPVRDTIRFFGMLRRWRRKQRESS